MNFTRKYSTNGRKTPFFTWQNIYMCDTYVVLLHLFPADETCIAMATSNETKFNFNGKLATEDPVFVAIKISIEYLFLLSLYINTAMHI